MIEDVLDAQAATADELHKKFYGVAVGQVVLVTDPLMLGRVKVKVPFIDSADLAAWARVASPMAGMLSGHYTIPNMGDEVLVAFEHGDVNAPYILGCLWNATAPPPLPSPLPQIRADAYADRQPDRLPGGTTGDHNHHTRHDPGSTRAAAGDHPGQQHDDHAPVRRHPAGPDTGGRDHHCTCRDRHQRRGCRRYRLDRLPVGDGRRQPQRRRRVQRHRLRGEDQLGRTMPLAARVGDPTAHPGVVTGPGVANVLIAGMPAAVVGDMHACSMPPAAGPHPPTPVPVRAARPCLSAAGPRCAMGDMSGCGAPIIVGAPTVLIGG